MLFGQTVETLGIKQYGGFGKDEVTASVVDQEGNLFIGGTSTQGLTMGAFSFQPTTYGNIDPFLAKLDSLGNVLWLKKVGSNDFSNHFWSAIRDMALDKNGNLWVLGSSSIAKFSNSGTLLSTIKMTVSSGGPNFLGITTDHNNNVIITGEFRGKLSFGPYTLTSAHNDYYNAFVAKFDSNGVPVWAKSYRNSNVYWDYCRGKAVTVDVNNDIYLGGEFETSITLGSFTLTSAEISSTAPFMVKLSGSSGTSLWASNITRKAKYVNGVAFYDNTIYAVGQFYLQKLSSSTGAPMGDIHGYGGTGSYLNDIQIDPTGMITLFGMHSVSSEFGGIRFPTPYSSGYNYPVALQLKSLDKILWYEAWHITGWQLKGVMSSAGLNRSYFVQNFDQTFDWGSQSWQTAGDIDFAIGRFGTKPIKSHFRIVNPPCDKESVHFMDSLYVNVGGSTITSYLWDFGDQTTSTEQNPEHVFPTIGNYIIKLTVSDNKGNSNSYSKSIYVSPAIPTPASDNAISLGEMNFRLRPSKPGNDGTTVWYTNTTSTIPFYEGDYLDITLKRDTVFYVKNRSYANCYSPRKEVKVQVGPSIETNITRLIKTQGFQKLVTTRDGQNNIYVAFFNNQDASTDSLYTKKIGQSTQLLAKISPTGKVLWMTQLSSDLAVFIGDMEFRSDSKLIVGGSFFGKFTFGSYTFQGASTGSEAFIGIIDPKTGTVEALNRFGEYSGEPSNLNGIEVDNGNNIYFIMMGSLRLPTGEVFTASGGNYSLVAKLSPNLQTVIWAKHVYTDPYGEWNRINGWRYLVKTPDRLIVGTELYEYASYYTPILGFIDPATGNSGVGPIYRANSGRLLGMKADPSGDVVIILQPIGGASFGNGSLNLQKAGNYLVKMSQWGSVLWTRRIADQNSYETDFTIDLIDKEGNIYVKGISDNRSVEQIRLEKGKNFLAKYTYTGELLWTTSQSDIGGMNDAQMELSTGELVSLKLVEDVTVNSGYEAGLRSLFMLKLNIKDFTISYVGHQKSVCLGETIDFNTTLFNSSTRTVISILWNFGDGTSAFDLNPQHLYQAAGTYPIKLTVTDSRNNFLKYNAEVTVNPLPDNALSISEDVVRVPFRQGNQYQWYRNQEKIPLATSDSYTMLESGNYFVEITSPQGCLAVSEMYEFIVTSIEPVTIGIESEIYPNPANQNIYIKLNNEVDPLIVSIYNVTGILLQETTINPSIDSIYDLDISQIPHGVYFIRLKNVNGKTRKFIKL